MIYYCNTIQEVVQFCLDEKTKQQAEESRIELDGLVIKINEFVTREQL
jgi:NAD-dependent DNA ligase